ncbi:15129_t:CDS:2, partial [Funneliformis mosseae]
QREARLIYEVTGWCMNNPRLGLYGSSQTCYNLPLPNPTVRGPDASVVLATRWNALSVNDQNEAFPSVAPNFVAEIRSDNDSEDYCHRKMIDFMNADVEEGILIDPLNQTVTVYRVQQDNIVMNVRRNPRTFTSRILNGFVLDLQ